MKATRMALIFTIALGGAFMMTTPIAWADGGSHCCGGPGHMLSRHPGHGHGGSTGHVLGYLLRHKEQIGLSDDQIAMLRTAALDADRAGIRARADQMVSERELRAMMWDGKADLPTIEAKVKETQLLEAALRIIRIRARRDLLAVLTPEQKTKLYALRGQRHSDHGRMRTEAERSPDGTSAVGASPDLPSAG
jgi:periplasmic protein CpxP/Spy